MDAKLQAGGVIMAVERSSDSHIWLRRELKLAGRTFIHRQCLVCHRDLVKVGQSKQWQAVYVGTFQFEFLDEQTSARWAYEKCPGRPLPGEANHLRLKVDDSAAASNSMSAAPLPI